MSDLGVAGDLKTKLFSRSIFNKGIDIEINEWLQENPDVEIIDIKYCAAVIENDEFYTSALIIYRDEEVF